MSKHSLDESSLALDYQTDNTWRQKAYRDTAFLASAEARSIRILCELVAPGKTFADQQINNAIVFFGSARSVEMAKAQSDLGRALNQGPEAVKKAQMAIRLARYHEDAIELARLLATWSNQILQSEKRFYITSGGGPGMMEAANKGANLAGANSIGLNITLPHEQNPNPYQTTAISFEFHYFFMRKLWFANLAKCLIVFPGGFGTMDELFELLTLRQTGKIALKLPIVLYGKDFWNGFLNFDHLLEWGVISQDDMKLFCIHDNPQEAFEYVKTRLTEEFL